MPHKAIEIREHSELPDNIVIFPPRNRHRIRREMELSYDIKHQPHAMILLLGALIGSMFALFIGYHLEQYFLNYAILLLIPVTMALFLRKVYVHTLIESMKH
jgi:hypothetical protein